MLIFLILSLGIYFCFINKYGWDWDTYAMIETYLNLLEEGKYLRSRGAGYIIPEIGIGFLSYYLGSFATNLITFLFSIIGLVFLYKSFLNVLKKNLSLQYKKENEILIIFLLICLTNHIVFRDSTIPMDYSWAFLFYSLGFYCHTKRQIELSIIFFSLSFGSRFNFIVFILPTILFLSQSFLDSKKKILISFIVITYGGLFYLPSWLQNSFSIDFIFSSQWYNSFKPAPVLSLEEFVRFSHKTISALGLFFFLYVCYILIDNKKKFLVIFKNYKIQIILILINLIVFFFFPWEPSFLWILIFSLNFILVTLFEKKILYILIFINLFTWFYEVKIIEVKYLNNGCFNQPIEAKLKLNLEKGIILNISAREEHTKCYPDLLGKNSKVMKYKSQFINGNRLLN
jgi:hypothetical protein